MLALLQGVGDREMLGVSRPPRQVTNGNGSMPAFGDKLGPDDIEDVANWVYNKADKW